METLTGDQLVSKIKVDSEAVIDRVIELYGNRILKLCFIQLNDRQESEDAAQEVFLKVCKNLKKYSGNSSMYTWIYRITINTCFDILQKRKKNNCEDISLYADYLPGSEDTEESLLKSLSSQNIRSALMQIDEKYRVILYMFYFEELKISQIASILSENENTIKTKIRRGKNALKRIIESEGI